MVKFQEEEEEKVYPSVMCKSAGTLGVACPPWVLLCFPCSVTQLPRELQEVTQVTQVTVRATSCASSCGSRAAASVSPVTVSCPSCRAVPAGAAGVNHALFPSPAAPRRAGGASYLCCCIPGLQLCPGRQQGCVQGCESRQPGMRSEVPSVREMCLHSCSPPCSRPLPGLYRSRIQSRLCCSQSHSFPSCLWCREVREFLGHAQGEWHPLRQPLPSDSFPACRDVTPCGASTGTWAAPAAPALLSLLGPSQVTG